MATSTIIIISLLCVVSFFPHIRDYFLTWKNNRDIQLAETVTSRNRGEWSELMTICKLLKMGIDNSTIFHDCYFKKANGTYNQVDLVVVAKVGLLVFEIKDYSGWIFGNSSQKYWTQVLAYGTEKHRFYNPLMQNKGHVDAILDNLPNNPNIPIYSIVVFWGDSIFKDVTIESGKGILIYSNDIKCTVNEIISKPDVDFGDRDEVLNVMRQAVKNGEDPQIVASQLSVATQAAKSKPQSTYTIF